MPTSTQIFLEGTKLSEFPAPPSLVLLQHDDPINQALKALTGANILSAPVMRNGACIGFCDMVDIVTEVVKIMEAKQSFGTFYGSLMDDEAMSSSSVLTAMGSSHRNPYLPLHVDSNLMEVIRIMSFHHARRVAIVDDDNTLINVITQSAVIDFLCKHLNRLTELSSLNLDQLRIPYRKVVEHVHVNTRAIEAFRLMNYYRISSVAVYDEDDKILTNISVRDLRAILGAGDDVLQSTELFLTAGEFISKVRAMQIATTKFPAISIRESATFKDLVERLHATKIHHIFVASDNASGGSATIIGIISTQDIIRPVHDLAMGSKPFVAV